MALLTHINVAKGFRGGERQTELLVRELAERGVPQRVIVRRNQPLQERLTGLDSVQVIPLTKPFAAHLSAFRRGFLHAHDGRGAHVAHWAHTILKTPYVITRRVDNSPSGSWATRRMYSAANGVAVLSKAIERVMLNYNPALNTIRIPSASSNAAPNETTVARLRSKWSGKFVVGQVGALEDRHKGQSDLIKAARTLLQEDTNWLFVLVGGGKDDAMLRAASEDIGERVVFTGHVDNVVDYLSAFDVMAYPSVHEGLGSTLLDAMGAGLPIVASDVDGIPEIVEHQREGLLAPPRDHVALAAALWRIRSESGLADKLAAAGLDKATGFTPNVMADRYLSWYKSVGFDVGYDEMRADATS